MKRSVMALATVAAVAVAATAALTAGAATQAGRSLDPSTRFYVPPPEAGAVQQGIDLLKARDLRDAALLGAMLGRGHAVWFTGGTPADAQKAVRKTMRLAAVQHAVPVLVAYDLPFRDCGQYSAGGATDTASYLAWIDGFAAGIGDGKAVVILEPDGLGIVPYNTPIYGSMEWCQPDLAGIGLTPAEANAQRYVQLNGAVDRLEQQPGVSVYLDGTHASWLGVGEAAYRLMKAGVARAQGFFLNVSNYRTTSDSTHFGTWISSCIAMATANSWYNPGWCPSQYNPAAGYQVDYSPEYAASVDAQYAGMLGGSPPTTHFVIDTSRNGQGPWTGPLDWCNPPGRGVGLRPTANTGVPLLDAYLWVKVPGESDGRCTRGDTSDGTDSAWGVVDPAAGDWFPQQALQLAQLASPPLLP